METRRLGRSGIAVGAVGMGCWAIGGPWRFDGRDAGWGTVDDDESIATIRRALDLGVTLFDTADVYGCGHSERVLGRGLAGRRDEAVITTKFGLLFDEARREGSGTDASPAYARRACEASLRRLGTDRIDLLLVHSGIDGPTDVPPLIDALERLIAEGKIRAYGTGDERPEIVRAFAQGPRCAAVEQQFNIFGGDGETLALAREARLASLARSPLAMGLLTGKYGPHNRPASGDVRRDTPHWTYFDDGAMEDWLERIAAVREHLSSGGRTLGQGALAWLLARSPTLVPIPGCRTVAQVEENARAGELGPLGPNAFAAIERALRG
jgi:aryl-alcohol dehydrogenase-like predicted oxidoreductase